LEAWLRPGSTSQPKTRTMIRYSSRTHMNRDPAATYPSGQTAAYSTAVSGAVVAGTPMIHDLARLASGDGKPDWVTP
jgi:hypothetical protein